MYKNYYRMRKEPFDSHPSPVLFYKSTAHQNAWYYLIHGIKNNEPILLVAGEYGAGKTLLFLKLVKLLETNSHLTSVSISTPTCNFIMLLEKILAALDIPLDGIDTSDESRLQQAIFEYFEKKIGEKKKFIYVVVDDAQEFSYPFMNKLRLFSSYNFSGYFPIRIVLFSHPDILKILKHQKMAAFGQRIKRINFLKPLNFEETREYIYFRLIHSGAPGTPVFEDEAISYIQTASKGNPRLINNICDNCLLVASNEKSYGEDNDTISGHNRGSDKGNVINEPLVSQAVAAGNLMGLEETQKPKPRVSSSALHGQVGSLFDRPPLSDARRYEQRLPEPEAYNHRKKYEDRTLKENDTLEKDAENKTGRKNFGSRYGRISIIIVLILIILFLFFYFLNQNRSDKMYNMQSQSEQIIGPMPDRFYPMAEHLYPIGKLNMFNDADKNNLSLNMVTGKDKLVDEKKYQPIILMGNLM